MQNVGDNYLR